MPIKKYCSRTTVATFLLGFSLPALPPMIMSCASDEDSEAHPVVGTSVSAASPIDRPALPNTPTVPVGALRGAAGVDDAGGATYRIGLDLPKGRAGLEPSLAIAYSSHSGQGALGLGFSLSATSQIERCGSKYAKDGTTAGVEFRNEDHFCWMGERLIEVSPTRFGSGIIREFRTERDQNARIVAFGSTTPSVPWSPDRWEIEMQSGLIQRFGNSSQSQRRGGRPNAPVDVFAWLLDQTRDRFGNAILYEYEKVVATDRQRVGSEDSEVLLSRVLYAQHLPSGRDAAYSVDFEYVPDPYLRMIGYKAGMLDVSSRLLQRINIKAFNHTLYYYEMTYRESAATRRALLASIRKCDKDNVCLEPTVFSYREELLEAPTPIDITPITTHSIEMFDLADVNGDGRSDFVRKYVTTHGGVEYFTIEFAPSTYVRTAQPGPVPFGGFTSTGLRLPYDSTMIQGFRSVDFNQDSRDDFLFYHMSPAGTPGGWRFLESTGTSFVDHPTPIASFGRQDWADFNGDGLLDLVQCLPVLSGDDQVAVALGIDGMSVEDLTTRLSRPIFRACDLGTTYPLDLGRDGAADLLVNEFPRAVRLSLRNGAIVDEPLYETPGGVARTFCSPDGRGCPITTDFNGDGETDVIVGNWPAAGENVIYYGTGFGMHGIRSAGGYDDGFPFPDGHFFEPSHYRLQPRPPVLASQSADLNLDGKADLIVPNLNTDSIDVNISSGIGTGDPATAFLYTMHLPVPDEGRGSIDFALGDVDGNGALDIVAWTGSRHLLFLFQQQRPDALLAINETSQAPTYQFSYSLLSDGAVYDRSTCASSFPTKCVAGDGYYVVRELLTDAGPSHSPRGITYRYVNGKTNVSGLGWVGFEKILATDSITGARSERRFDLRFDTEIGAYPFKDDAFIEETTTEVTDPDGANGRVTYLERRTVEPNIIKRPDGTYFTVRRSDQREVFEGPQLLARRTEFVDRYDDFGIPRTVRVEVQGETVVSDRRTYNDVDHWFIGRTDFERVTATTPNEQREWCNAWGWDPPTASLRFDSSHYGCAGLDPLRTTTTFARDGYGNVVSVTTVDNSGAARVSYAEFDSFDHQHLVSATNALGQATKFEYDPFLGVLLREEAPSGAVSRWVYDRLGRLSGFEGSDGVMTSIVLGGKLDTLYGHLTIAESRPGTPLVSVEVDRLGRPFRTVRAGFDGEEVEERGFFDREGRLVERWLARTVAPLPPPPQNRERWSFDELGRVIKHVSPGGGYSVFDYDPGPSPSVLVPSGQDTHEWDPRGQRTSYRRDGAGRLLTATDALGGMTTYSYGPASSLQRVTDPLGSVTTILRDAYGWRKSLDEGNAGVSTFDYTPFGEVWRTTDASGNVATFTYDALGRVRTRTDGDGSVSVFTYDLNTTSIGLLARSESPDGERVDYFYDSAERLVREVHEIGAERFQFDFTFDQYGRSFQTIYPEAADGTRLAIERRYQNGYLAAVSDVGTGQGIWARLKANAAGQTTAEILGNGVQSELTYTAYGKLQSTKSYGGLGRAGTSPFRDQRYDYDQSGNTLGRTDRLGSWQERFALDPLERLTSACIAAGTGAVAVPPRADGRPASWVGVPDPPLAAVQARTGVDREVVALPPMRLGTSLSIGSSDPIDNRLVLTLGTAQTSATEWMARFASPIRTGCLTATYDAGGNLRSRSDVGTYEHKWSLSETISTPQGAVSRIRKAPHALSKVTKAGASRFLSYDPTGRLLDNGLEKFEWTPRGQVRAIINKADQWEVRIRYGATGQRLEKETPSELTTYVGPFQRRRIKRPQVSGFHPFVGALVAAEDHYFIEADGRTVAQIVRHSSGLSEIEPGFNLSSTGLGVSVAELLARLEEMKGTALKSKYSVYFFHPDALGSVEVVTGPTGLTIEERSYNAWGQLRAHPANPTSPTRTLWPTQRPVDFTGHEADEEFGLVNMRGRIYDPRVGKMLSADPFVAHPERGQSYNRYAYVLNNPATLIDPTGFSDDEPGGPRFGGAFAGGTEPGGPRFGSGRSQGDPMRFDPLDVVGAIPPESPTGGESGSPRAGVQATERADRLQVDRPSGPNSIARRFLEFVNIDPELPGIVHTLRVSGQDDSIETSAIQLDDLLGVKALAKAAFVGGVAVFTVGMVALKEGAEQAAIKAGKGGASVILDTNALVAAVEHGRAILGGRAPIVPITVAKEFLEKGSPEALREFLTANGGRIGLAGAEGVAATLRQQAAALNRVLRVPDSRVAAGAMREGLPIMTNDGKFGNFLRAIGYPVEGF